MKDTLPALYGFTRAARLSQLRVIISRQQILEFRRRRTFPKRLR